MKRKAVVTGGAGFIGSHLIDLLLKKNFKVIVVDDFSTGHISNIRHFKKNITLIQSDISKKGKWTNVFRGVDVVFHLAAKADIVPSVRDPISYFDSNVVGTLNVLESCIKYKVNKIIYAASSSCYGIPKKYPTDEKSEIKPEYPYALTKNLGEQLILHWSKVYNIISISLRLFNVYGLRSRTSGTYGAVFGVFLAQKINNKPYTVVGNGRQKRDFIYVTDVAEAFYQASKYNKTQIFNVGSGKPKSINSLIKILKGKKVNIPKRPGEPNITYANIKKISKELNWRTKISFEEGVAIILNNIKLWQKAPLWDPKKIEKETKDWFKYIK